jgi:hypothetical protein
MQFRLLGSVEVAEQNMAAALGGVNPRSLLAIRRGAGQDGLAPDDPGTRFRWSLTGAGS